MKLLNEAQIINEWAPVIQESTGVTDKGKLNWMSKYCHFHTLNESSYLGAGAGFMYPQASLQNTPGMGNVVAPQYGSTGSGDKFPSLLPLAIQVGARTVGFDIVPVIPMNGPTGVLTYMDYVYAGGKNPKDPADANAENPILIKAAIETLGSGVVLKKGVAYQITKGSGNTLSMIYVGKSRIDGDAIFRVLKPGEKVKKAVDGGYAWFNSSSTPGFLVAEAFAIDAEIEECGSPATSVATVAGKPSLVKALEDHIQGFTGAGEEDAADWAGNFVDGKVEMGPMRRGIGEQTYYRTMGLETFTKLVEAQSYQVAATVTTEQIQDLNRQFGIDVVGMVENSLVNEISQSINKHILSRAFALGWSNHAQFAAVEGQNLNLNVAFNETKSSWSFIGKDGKLVDMDGTECANYGSFENQGTFQRRIQSRILAAGNVIAQRGRRGPANFIVTNLQIATILQDSAQFQMYPMANTVNQSNGSLYPVGSIAGMAIYVDPNMEWSDTRVLVGRKGADEEPGLKYMPYIMAEKAQTIAEGTMAPKVAIKSRYALVEAGFFPETQYLTFAIQVPGAGLV